MPQPDLVVVGASAGGVEALSQLVAGLPAGLPASVLIVLHVPSTGHSRLPEILERVGPMPVRVAEDGQRAQPGRMYVAPPDRHLLVAPDCLRVTRGPRENFHRPAIDPLFRSAADVNGTRVIGVVLSGANADGAAGMQAIQARGGTVIIQDPRDAAFPMMPQAAAAVVRPDHVLSVPRIGGVILELLAGGLAQAGARPPAAMPPDEHRSDPLSIELRHGSPSGFGCPECGGVLSVTAADGVLRYRCRIGHAYSSDVLLDGQRQTIDSALAVALRALEETAELAARLAERSRSHGRLLAAVGFDARAAGAVQDARTIRRALRGAEPQPVSEASEVEALRARG